MKDWLKLRESLREKKDSEICSNANNPYAETHQLDKKYFENMIKDILGDDYEKLVTTHGILEKCSTDNQSLDCLYQREVMHKSVITNEYSLSYRSPVIYDSLFLFGNANIEDLMLLIFTFGADGKNNGFMYRCTRAWYRGRHAIQRKSYDVELIKDTVKQSYEIWKSRNAAIVISENNTRKELKKQNLHKSLVYGKLESAIIRKGINKEDFNIDNEWAWITIKSNVYKDCSVTFNNVITPDDNSSAWFYNDVEFDIVISDIVRNILTDKKVRIYPYMTTRNNVTPKEVNY